ncbi:MAG: TIGR00266 family protein [Anaerolineaceae bacterium]|nr:TIGR00266 family protein [Anaerolineaceae bacterium]
MNYEIRYEPFPVLMVNLEDGEQIQCQAGAMSWMTPNMEMQTSTGGGLGKLFSRVISGENAFVNKYAAHGKGMIAFSSDFVGQILAVEIKPGQDFVVQQSGYLASFGNVEQTVFFQKRLGAAFFGGEGFIMQRFSGSGIVFVEIDGYCQEYTLAAGQQMVLSTGYLAAMDATCKMDVQSVKGAMNMLFGSESFFNTIVTGPGKIYVQTKPISKVAQALKPYFPQPTSSSNN